MKRIIKTRRTLCMALPLLLLPLCAGLCSKKHATCHHELTFVNNSDTAISLRSMLYYDKEGQRLVTLDGRIMANIEESTIDIEPNDILVIKHPRYYCFEEILGEYEIYIVPKATLNETTWTTIDSLEYYWDILKIIDLAEMGVDSLRKTNFTVYYP